MRFLPLLATRRNSFRWIVAPKGAGSSPVGHPRFGSTRQARRLDQAFLSPARGKEEGRGAAASALPFFLGGPSLGALTLRGDDRPRGREFGGAACGVGGCGRHRPPDAHLLGGREGEGGVAAAVGGDGLLPYELLALVAARRVGEELHGEGPVWDAVEPGAYGRLERAGLGRAHHGPVLQAVGAGVGVAGVVGGG